VVFFAVDSSGNVVLAGLAQKLQPFNGFVLHRVYVRQIRRDGRGAALETVSVVRALEAGPTPWRGHSRQCVVTGNSGDSFFRPNPPLPMEHVVAEDLQPGFAGSAFLGRRFAVDVHDNVVATGLFCRKPMATGLLNTPKYTAADGALLWGSITGAAGTSDGHAVVLGWLRPRQSSTEFLPSFIWQQRLLTTPAKYAAGDGALVGEKPAMTVRPGGEDDAFFPLAVDGPAMYCPADPLARRDSDFYPPSMRGGWRSALGELYDGPPMQRRSDHGPWWTHGR